MPMRHSALLLLAASLPALAAPRPALTVYESAEALTEACTAMLKDAGERVEQLSAGPVSDSAEYFHRGNELDAATEDVLGSAALLTYVHPDKTIRDAGEACTIKFSEFQTGLFQNEALYERVKAVEPEDEIDEKLRNDLLNTFTDTGVSLPAEPRKRAKAILDQLQALNQEFDRNLRENKTRLKFSAAELQGLPDSYLQQHKKDADGGLTLGFDYPHYVPFMTFAASEAARERYYRAFQNRGTDRNLAILDEIVGLRRELAGLHDLDSFAELVTQRNMVGDPDTVTDFLNEVREIVDEVETRDIETLRQAKAEHLGKCATEVRVFPWDKEFYLERLRQSRHQVDQNALRKYFPSEPARDWVLKITSDLYGLRFAPRSVPVWHEDVRYYDVLDAKSNQFIGGLYLDLYPREGKYGHAAAFSVRGSSTLLKRTPITTLVTNFDRRGLTQDELETLLHEFGHALHGVLSRTRYVAQSGTNVARDFVEAPSQMYEAWAQRADTLSLMKEVCSTCPLVDTKLAQRLDAARKLGSGLFYGRQHLYASYDMQLAGEEPGGALSTWKAMEAGTPFRHIEGTAFPGTFSHIAGGYAAGYYGYMWALAIALDMRSAFGANFMDAKVGRRFREVVLASGGEQPARDLVKQFLDRDPEMDAFFAEIRGGPPDQDAADAGASAVR